MRLATRIFVVFAATLLAVTATATALNIQRGTHELARESEEMHRQDGLDTARSVRQAIDSTERLLASAAALFTPSDFESGLDQQRAAAILDPVFAHNFGLEALFLVDHAGNPLAARPLGTELEGFTVDAHEGSALMVGHEAHPLAWCVRVPAAGEGDAAHYLVGLVNLNYIETILFRGRLPGTEAALLATERVVASTDPAFVVPSPRPQPPATVASAVWHLGDGRTVTQEPVVEGASVMIVDSGATAAALRSRLVEESLITALVVATTGILLGAWFSRQATRPLARLQVATHSMAAGRLETRVVPEGAGEFRELAEDFNAMAANLQSDRDALQGLRVDLERRVQQRTEELRRQKEDMELFFYTVAHDIKSPAIAVRGYTELLEDLLAVPEPDVAEVRRLLSRVGRSGENLERLVREVLQFAHAERAAPRWAPCDIQTIVRGVVTLLEPTAREKAIRFTVHGGSLEVISDPERLHHILGNLVQNAVKYMPPGPARRVAVAWSRQPGGGVLLRVSDNGAGIPADLRQHLFRPFTRHVRETVGTEGTGLGLSIVDRNVRSLGGTVRYQTMDGTGTTFWVELPPGPVGGDGAALEGM